MMKIPLFLGLLVGIANCCDPPATIDEINTTCPSEAEMPNTSVTYPDPDHCSRYYECFNGCSAKLQCASGTLYDDFHGWCNTATEVYCGDRDCDGESCRDTPVGEIDEDFDCPADGYYADPTNCIKYVQCAGGKAMRITCPKAGDVQELYKEDKQWCDYPENVECKDRPICDTNDQNCSLQPTVAPTACDGITCSSGQLEAEGPCSQCFCECNGVAASEICCQEGLVFNPTVNVCDFPYNVPACG